MTVTINGATGIAGVDGSANLPSVQGADTNTGMFFPATDTVAITTGGTERMRINASGQAEFTAGTAALPAITTTGDTNTGVFFPAADVVDIATGGTAKVRVDSAGLTLNGSTSGTLTVAAPAVAGTNTQTLVAATGTLAPLISETAQASTSGTSIDFTSIPSWVKRITVMLNNVSTAAINANTYIRIGTGTVETTGYNTNYIQTNGSSTFGIINTAVGFHVGFISSAANTMVAVGVINLIGNNTWTYSANCFENAATRAFIATGSITLGASLNVLSVVLTSSSFDAGSINIMYE